MLLVKYIQSIRDVLQQIEDSQIDNIKLGAERIASSLVKGGIAHVYGSGHSVQVVMEFVGRAGGLVPINPIPDPSEGVAERVQGYGSALLNRYEEKCDLKPEEVVIVISASGRNPAPIEVAIEARKRGLFTIAITSMEFSRQVTSRHSSGKKLFEVADLVLDSCVPAGDALG